MVGNSRFQKKANRALILNYLHFHGPESRNILARELGLQPSTVTYIVQGLIKEGMVQEADSPSKKAANTLGGSGRKPVEISLSPRYGCMIGLDLQVDYYVAVIYDLAGNKLKSDKLIYRKKNPDFKLLLKETVEEIESSLDIPVLGLGLALPGIIDSGNNRVIDCWTHNLRDSDLSTWLGGEFSFPVIIENDANCAAFNHLKQMKFQKKRYRDISFIYLLPRFHDPLLVPENQPSVGIGMGFVLNGGLYRGANFKAGEYQSILSSQKGVPSRQLSLSDKELSQARYSKTVQRAIVKELMDSMKLILQIFDPSSLIIGGDMAEREIMEKYIKGDLFKNYPIEMGKENFFDPAEGACALVFEKLFSIPQIGTEKGRSK
jgi:predicted NBD/HSP70 family sugar kinase